MPEQVQELRITKDEFTDVKNSEALVVGEWERDDDGHRWGEFLISGTIQECEEFAGESEIVIVPDGFKCLGKTVIHVKDLLPPKVSDDYV